MAKDFMIESVYQQLRAYVLENQLNDHMKLNQNTLAEQLNVSRTPVVKALYMLESEGLVDNIPRRGFYIHTPTVREVSELFTLRQALEVIAVSGLCRHGRPEDFDTLEACFAPFMAEKEIDYDTYHQADIRFHQLIFSFCHNRLITRINDSLQIMSRVLSFGLLRDPAETLKEHQDILQAMRNRNEAQARELARRHTEKSCQYLDHAQQQLLSLGLDPDQISAKDIHFPQPSAANL